MVNKLIEKNVEIYLIPGHIYYNNDYIDLNPIEAICINGNINIYNSLYNYAKDKSIFQKNYDNKPLIFESIRYNHIDIVKLQINDNNINVTTPIGDTPLLVACKHGNSDIALFLIEYGVDVNARNDKIETALMYACKNNLIEVVKILVKLNVDVNIQNEDDITALMFAAKEDNIDIINILLSSGALVSTLTDKNGFTAMDLAKSNAVTNILRVRYNEERNRFNKHEPLIFNNRKTSSPRKPTLTIELNTITE